MTTGLLVTMAVCLTVICLGSLTLAGFLVWWTMSSSGQHSISAGKQQTLALESMKEMVGQSATMVGSMAELSEMLLLGRPVETSTTSPSEPVETVPVSSMMPADLWERLPEPIKATLIREATESEVAGIWPEASETLQPGSEGEWAPS